MPTQKNIGENDGLDSTGIVEDVSYTPTEKDADTPDEKSDAQRIADGDIAVTDEDSEMFVSPDSVFHKPAGDDKKEESPEEKKEEAKPGETPDGKKEEKPETDKPSGEKPEEKKEGEKDKKPPAAAPDPIQKRINKATREKYEAIRRAEAAEAKAKKLEDELNAQKVQAEKAKLESEKPKAEDFENVDDYQVALGKWAAKTEIYESKSQEAQKPKEEKKQEPDEDPRKRIVDLGQETYPDFLEVVGAVPLTEETFNAASDSDHAVEIFYHLGQNPETAKKLASLKSPVAIAREIGRIEAQFIDNVPEVKASTGGEDTELPKDSKKPKPPSAPPPIKPVGGAGKVSKTLEDASIGEYYAQRGYTRDGMKKSRVA